MLIPELVGVGATHCPVAKKEIVTKVNAAKVRR